MRMLVIATAVFLGMALLAPAVTAAPFPERDISVIVPWAAGGGTDALARTLAKNGKKYFGVNVTVVNKVGGAGGIGMGSVATAKPDGHLLRSIGKGCRNEPVVNPKPQTARHANDDRVIAVNRR